FTRKAVAPDCRCRRVRLPGGSRLLQEEPLGAFQGFTRLQIGHVFPPYLVPATTTNSRGMRLIIPVFRFLEGPKPCDPCKRPSDPIMGLILASAGRYSRKWWLTRQRPTAMLFSCATVVGTREPFPRVSTKPCHSLTLSGLRCLELAHFGYGPMACDRHRST